MAKAKKPRYFIDQYMAEHKAYVRAWKDRREWAVQVWPGQTAPEGEPAGDWGMPGVLGLHTAIAQAVLQTRK